MLQIANITAIALVMVSEGCDKRTAEGIISMLLGEKESLIVAYGCKLYIDRSNGTYSIGGYHHQPGEDVRKALAEADKLAITLRGTACAQSIADACAFDAANSWDPTPGQPNWSRS